LAPELARSAVEGRSVLITGAGGSIGHRLALAALSGDPRRLVLLDVSEAALYESYRRLAAASAIEIVPVTGSVADGGFLAHLLAHYNPDVIFHAAAYKHVPLMERNPFSAVANNAIGTYTLAIAALEAGVSRVIAVSTDKAVHPRSFMGASKRIAELALLSHSNETTRMNAIRLCNVLGSSGSVSALFEEQAEHGSPLTVTHPEAERYFLAPAEAEAAILRAAASPAWGRILVPDCGQPFRIVDLARFIAKQREAREAGIEFTGPRPGDKLREDLLAEDEIVEAQLAGGIRVVASPHPGAKEIAVSMQRLQLAVDRFDYPELLAAITELVPSYVAAEACNSPDGLSRAR
jgi:FlaA1/EpsC-like NDP-sugar epimerase